MPDHPSKAEAFTDANLPRDTAPLPPAAAEKLDAIRNILDRMLLLAQTAADPSAADAERASLQKELDRLRAEIDAIADEWAASGAPFPPPGFPEES